MRDRHPAARPSVEDGDRLHLDQQVRLAQCRHRQQGHRRGQVAAGPRRGARVVQGVPPAGVLAPLATGTAVALLVAAGDDLGRCRRSVQRAWAGG
ncbi:hypothetical protein [Geodermatophilus sp. URMC 63]